ncbi:MAG TPA: prolipoprotein diacylglyceryl transferase [Rhodospirillaceae bacterium]|mgnify:FL=1|jgi:phosphatidylglycerol:prolipoprotein diacylglycerol transferase|uniref:prolipoprotein diacylglyceryl transferase n=1 Tax=unclassified Hwanghaeella TaxID=2605944 RepID=UPI000C4EE9AC|nr:prolipoprotein diacylglyceryl transferase [Rhodospirillaceae bacterium]MAO90188.1 prolipoprotein diacylglyceryl transferase [Rhodospirillales bacterium]MAX62782.1 prolipoprotein diacylglyceryl transferase [Rhodospirillaceae bacterium]HAJ21597.1 prolipoprotein diacylglyceryl transferase [Rhodospirillaceae bacterium]HBM11924.1 prolipoprotein diacylglyceryl transferase [Rhodospirillaceae bacterium]|tara:strand:+ start:9075 stop:9899 length:825 start_codon:yes stop_codon:yes gene_type:complete
MEQSVWIHDLDPVIFSIGPFDLRWYALAYIVGLVVGWRWGMRLAAKSPQAIQPDHVDRFLNWAVIGVIVGGRLGVVLFYHPAAYFADPIQILMVWKGGMSFHGGVLGVLVAMLIFARMNKIPLFSLTDIVCTVAPFGIMLGRIANFINGEHWGRVTDVPWAIAFPHSGDLLPRHPSQLYECAMEGVLLLTILIIVQRRFNGLARPGLQSGVFLIGYACARMAGEIFREPEILMQTLPFGTTWGQWLSLPMLLGGAYLVYRALQQAPLSKSPKKA